MPSDLDPTAPPTNPMRLVGAILAQGVIRLLERRRLETLEAQDRLDNPSEQSVSSGVPTTQKDTSD